MANLKYKVYSFLTTLLGFAASAILNYFGSNPRILYFPVVAFWLWIGWVMISCVHTYISKTESQKTAAFVHNDHPSSALTEQLASPEPQSQKPLSTAPNIITGNTITSENQIGGFTGINTGTVNLAPVPRTLNIDQQSVLISGLRGKLQSQICFILESTAPDSETLAQHICGPLQAADCRVFSDFGTCAYQPPLKGIWIEGSPSVSEDIELLKKSLRKAGVPVHDGQFTNGVIGSFAQRPGDTITISIGRRE